MARKKDSTQPHPRQKEQIYESASLVYAVVIAFTLTVSIDTVQANLISNGDFSGGATGWTSVGTVQFTSGLVNLGGGGNNRGAVYQSISTTAGDWYSVTYSKLHAGVDINSALMVTAFDGTGNATADAYWGESYNGTDNSIVTRYFQAQGTTTTLQFRDFNYNGPSHDVRVDNIVVEKAAPNVAFATNIAGQATLTQSSFLNAGLYPASHGVDGVPNNFVHTNNADPEWYDLTFATPVSVDRLVVSIREGFANRAGDEVLFFDASDVQIGSATALGDGSFIYTNDLIRQPVKRIRVRENGGNFVNFAEVEVYAVTKAGVGGPVTLIDESFANNAGLNADKVHLDWADNDGGPNSFETYGPGGAGARGMSSTYDHDNNVGTAQIDILGGIEVNDTGSNLTLTATVDLPLLSNTTGGFIEFWAGLRGNPAGDQTFDIVNVTDSRDIILGQVIDVVTSGGTRDWMYNSFLIPFIDADLGDQIEVRFHATGNGAEGLQLTDLLVTIDVPAPSALPAGLTLLGVIALRRRRA